MRKAVIDIASLNKLKSRREALKGTESFPYSEDLRSVMVSDVMTCSPEEKVNPVVKRMVDKKTTSSIVVGEHGRLVGILTAGDVLKRIVAR
ncbi:hypothetical protein LCGC14_2603250, partial [marine sediment metagenome]